MRRHTLKLLALSALFSVAPAAAGDRVLAASPNHDECPFERAQAEAAAQAWAAQTPAVRKGPITITLTDRAPADGSLLGLGRGGFVNP